MRIEKVHIKSQFKNLNDFSCVFADVKETVLLGLNATGKSNFMEAIVIIFRDLDLERVPTLEKKRTSFEYYIKYNCRGYHIEIEYSKSIGYRFNVNGKKLKSRSEFYQRKSEYLPSHVFVYYSGLSERLKSLYSEHKIRQFKKMMKPGTRYEDFKEMPRIFLVEPIHAAFALIAFYLYSQNDIETIDFLKEELNIHDFGSALFMLKKPKWSDAKERASDFHDKFWHSEGLVRRFIEDLWRFSTAPIFHKEKITSTLTKKETINRLYLYIKDKTTFQDLADGKMFENKIPFFNALCSLHFSELVDEDDVRIKVQKENIDGELAMGELSEGEKQLITVLGLLKFTKDDETLILLDEPDTHLNPHWKYKYLEYLNDVVSPTNNTQVIFCTHDPIVIGGMKKEQVRIFSKDETNRTIIRQPNVDPQGLGVAGILTSGMFGMKNTIDPKTNNLLNERNYLMYKQQKGNFTEEDQTRLKELYNTLSSLGFNHTFKDPEYSKYIVAKLKEIEED